MWSNEERAKGRGAEGDKGKSDGGQAAASPAALVDSPPPSQPPKTLLRQDTLFAQGDK